MSSRAKWEQDYMRRCHMYQPVRYRLDNLHVLTSRNLNPRHNSRAHRDEANPTVPQCWEPVSHDVLKCDIVAYNFFPTKCGYLFFKTRAWLHLLLNLLPLFLRLVDSGRPSTRATRAMALVLALNYSGQIIFFYSQAQLALMPNVMALVLGQSWVPHHWIL